MHRSGVILCCWPWKLLERSGSSSLGGPEKVATVKVTSILLCPTPPRPPPSLTLSLPFVFFSFFSPCVDQHAHVRARTQQSTTGPGRYSREQPKLAGCISQCTCTRPEVPPSYVQNENEIRIRNLDPAVTVTFERSSSYSFNSNMTSCI